MKSKLLFILTIMMMVFGTTTLSAKKFSKYLFVYFPANDNENIYYALSDKDTPFDFVPMNDGKKVVSADTIAIKKGVRDPHVLRGNDGWFYMVNTDMRCAEGWASNRGMVLMRSKDLVNWQHSTVHFPEKYKGTNFANVTRVWAPEVIWDSKAKKYLVYFSLLTNDGTIPYDKVYYCYANKDFTDLEGEPIYFYDRGSATIDMDIVYSHKDKLYLETEKMPKIWDLSQPWGWDTPLWPFPGARSDLNFPRGQYLERFHKRTNTYLVSGHNYQDQRLRLYLPGNGGLLTAVALMCAGWDGCKEKNPGFPAGWDVEWEGLLPMP